MRFEHLVVVNEPANPLITDLTREDIWFGLLCRVEDSRPFLPGLDCCTIIARDETVVTRELRFGSVLIRDTVVLHPLESVRFESEPSEEHAGGSLTISIEEPSPAALMLRFVYQTTLPEGGGGPDQDYAGFVKSAYLQSDVDTVRMIRMLAASRWEA